mgnify:CR=1 FL=1
MDYTRCQKLYCELLSLLSEPRFRDHSTHYLRSLQYSKYCDKYHDLTKLREDIQRNIEDVDAVDRIMDREEIYQDYSTAARSVRIPIHYQQIIGGLSWFEHLKYRVFSECVRHVNLRSRPLSN